MSLMIYGGHAVIEVARQAGHTAETSLRHYARVFEEYDPAERRDAATQIRMAREQLETERLDGIQQAFAFENLP